MVADVITLALLYTLRILIGGAAVGGNFGLAAGLFHVSLSLFGVRETLWGDWRDS